MGRLLMIAEHIPPFVTTGLPGMCATPMLLPLLSTSRKQKEITFSKRIFYNNIVKMKRQLSLFGEYVERKPVYKKDNLSLYQRFLNAFVSMELEKGNSLKDAKEKGDKRWKDYYSQHQDEVPEFCQGQFPPAKKGKTFMNFGIDSSNSKDPKATAPATAAEDSDRARPGNAPASVSSFSAAAASTTGQQNKTAAGGSARPGDATTSVLPNPPPAPNRGSDKDSDKHYRDIPNVASLPKVDTSNVILDPVRRSVVEYFLEHLKINPDDILTPDVTSVPTFVVAIANAAARFNQYEHTMINYDSFRAKRWKKQTKIDEGRVKVNEQLSSIKETLVEISNIRVRQPSGNLKTVVSQSVLLKASLIHQVTASLSSVQITMDDVNERARVRIQQKKSQQDPIPNSNEYKVRSLNDCSLSWDQAVERLIMASSDEFPGPLSDLQLIECANTIRDMSVISMHDIIKKLRISETSGAQVEGILGNLLKWLPIMAVSRGFRSVVVNLHDIIYDESLLFDILSLDHEEPEEVTVDASGKQAEGLVS